MGHFDFFGAQGTIFGVGEVLMNCFWVYSCSWTTSILYVSVNSYICFSSILGSFWHFRVMFSFFGPQLTILGIVEGFTYCFFWSTHVVEQLSYCMFPSFLVFDFYLIGVIFDFLGPYTGLFLGLSKSSKNCFGFYSSSLTTFICSVFFNSDIWFWLHFGVIFDVLGP